MKCIMPLSKQHSGFYSGFAGAFALPFFGFNTLMPQTMDDGAQALRKELLRVSELVPHHGKVILVLYWENGQKKMDIIEIILKVQGFRALALQLPLRLSTGQAIILDHSRSQACEGKHCPGPRAPGA